MTTKFAELEVYTNDDEVILKQFLFGEDDQVIGFPFHQARAVCKAIMAASKGK